MYFCTECEEKFHESDINTDCPICDNGLIEDGDDNLIYFVTNDRTIQ